MGAHERSGECAARKLMQVLHGGNILTALPWERRWRRGISVALCMLCLQRMTAAQATDEPQVVLVAEVREEMEVAPGRRVARLVPAGVLHQGQEIFYTVRIRNPATTPLQNVEVVQRIPQNTAYVPGSAAGPGAEVSVSADGGQTFGKEGQLSMVDQSAMALTQATSPDRESLTRQAMPQDYTHIRWRLRYSLAPGAVALARFRAVFQ